ncbi:MAG: thermonuclease family protein [Anaerolineales bacterium]
MSKQKRSKLPFGCLIIAGIVATICGATVSIRVLSGFFAPAPVPTLDNNAIATAAFQTALAMNLETQAAFNPTPEPTFTSLPTATDTQAPLPTATDAFIPVTGASCIPNNPPQTGKVVEVTDGDTIKVLLDQDGRTYSVRYIGMDTPENTSQIEYFGPEAAAKNAELVYGKNVTLIKDVSETDPYNRLLRYVIADDVFVNYELVAQGYANTASYSPDVACIPTFQTAERQALSSKLGFWGAPPTQAVVLPLPTATLAGSGNSGGNAPCSCSGPDLDCKDFKTHAAAQYCYDYCVSQGHGDVFRLDGSDNDGLACESLP